MHGQKRYKLGLQKMSNKIKIFDDFLNEKDLSELENIICNCYFPWYFQESQTNSGNGGSWFSHILYEFNTPQSEYYQPIINIFNKYIEYITLCRLNVNLLAKNDTSKFSDYHIDLEDVKSDIMTTAIFYLNTNNGATEFKSGEGIDSIKNRLVVFPKNTYHRAVSQTDMDKRIVLNFNYISENQ
jgi:hypothetical protein